MTSKPKTVDLIEHGSPLTLLNIGRIEWRTATDVYGDALSVYQYGEPNIGRTVFPDGWFRVHVCEPLQTTAQYTVSGPCRCRECGRKMDVAALTATKSVLDSRN